MLDNLLSNSHSVAVAASRYWFHNKIRTLCRSPGVLVSSSFLCRAVKGFRIGQAKIEVRSNNIYTNKSHKLPSIEPMAQWVRLSITAKQCG